MALADVFDALISKRVYKKAFSLDETAQIITDGRAKHFDPELVDIFLSVRPRFVEIAERHKDAQHS
jgi:putative two-component system response regulator